MGRSDGAIRRCWQKWAENGRFQRHDGNGRPRATADPEERLIVRSAVTASDSSLSNVRRTTRTRVSPMAIHRRLIEQSLTSCRLLRYLPFTPLYPNEHRGRDWRNPGQRADPAFTIARHTGLQPGVIVSGAIYFDNRTSLVVIRAHLQPSGTSMTF
ncbi:HTH_Tnp_Tc3_2 domain-containing protein [Trichonephila clavipes]|nr:HTH_Tnp_Tc3_2 domain-containing protein [Trichonephila clavipes]